MQRHVVVVQSTNADVSVFETVEEVQISTSAFSAQYGVGGIIMNQISKGGTSSFHGSLYEYFQNDALNAAGYQFGNPYTAPHLRYNNYGGSVGGPILRKKMFFFFDYDKTVNNGSNIGLTTVPTAAMLAGDFTGQPLIYDPTTQVITQTKDGPVVMRKSFAEEYGQGNKIPAGLIDPVAKAIAAFYPTPSNHTSAGIFVAGDQPPAGTLGNVRNNYRYNVLNPNPATKYFGRLDYDVTPHNRITLSDTQRDQKTVAVPYIYACPIGCQNSDIDSNNAQVSDVWNISPSVINEARFGFTSQLDFFVAPTLNQNYPAKLGLLFSKANLFPFVTISGNNCCDAPQPGTNATYKQNVFDPSDVVTMIRGRHVLHFGGELLAYRQNGTAWGNINPAAVQFSGTYTQSTVGDSSTGIGFADFLLGQAQSWSAAVKPEYGVRLKAPQVFLQDDFKVKPNLTLNLGLRYQMQLGVSEVKNDISAFDPTVLNPANSTKGALWYATTHANGRKDLIAPIYNTFLPRVGFSWLPKSNTTIRGGVGLYAYLYNLDQNGQGVGTASAAQGNLQDQTNGISPVVILSSTGSQLPYTTPGNDPAAFAGQGLGYSAYHTPVGKSMQWNLAIQRELGTNMVAEVAYVASHGYDLFFPVDLNQIPAGKLSANDGPADRPYPYWGGIYGSIDKAISNYHSLQTSVSKRLTSGLSFNFNYTWSHFLNSQDSGNNGTAFSIFQTANPAANYGASQFDVRHALKGRIVYTLPFGKGQRFLNNNPLVDAALGGWQASSTLVLSTGNPFTPIVNGPNLSYSQAGTWYPDVIGNHSLSKRSIQQWFNPANYSAPAPGTFGNMRRNSVYGPGLEVVNLSAGKTFILWRETNLKIRVDAFNALNHASFALPNSYLDCSGPGVPCTATTNITSTSVGGRTLQLGARLAF